MAARRRVTARKTSGVRAATQAAATKRAATVHHNRRLGDALTRNRGGTTKDGKPYARRLRGVANRRHKIKKPRDPLHWLLDAKLDPFKWLRVTPGYAKKRKRS